MWDDMRYKICNNLLPYNAKSNYTFFYKQQPYKRLALEASKR